MTKVHNPDLEINKFLGFTVNLRIEQQTTTLAAINSFRFSPCKYILQILQKV